LGRLLGPVEAEDPLPLDRDEDAVVEDPAREREQGRVRRGCVLVQQLVEGPTIARREGVLPDLVRERVLDQDVPRYAADEWGEVDPYAVGLAALTDGRGVLIDRVVPFQPEPESSGPTIVCRVCDTVNDATRTYCRKCANELKSAEAAPPPPPPPPGGRKISPLAIGLGAAGLVLAVGIVAILALNGGTQPGASPTLAAQVSGSPGVTGPPSSEGPSASAGSTAAPTEPPFTEGEPEGRIVFARCVGNTDCVLFLINADGTEVGPLTDVDEVGSATDPRFSTDGKRVIFTVRDGLRILNIASGVVTVHSPTRGDTNGSWSPDDSMVTFSGARDRDPVAPVNDREIRRDALTGQSQPLTANGIVDHDPVFLDDRRIIWVQGEGDQRELKMINFRNGRVTDLTSDEFNDVDPAVSPDGSQIAFASTRGSGEEFDLFLMDLSTLAITPLTTVAGDEHDPAWSPGGRYIVFSGGDQDSNNLYLLDLADGVVEELTSTAERDLAPAWRP